MVTALLLLGCATPDLDPQQAADLLTRVSLNSRGVRPSIEDLDTVAADPALLPALAEGYLNEPAARARVRDHWAEVFLTVSERQEADLYGLFPDVDRHNREAQRIGEEPVRIVERIFAEERDFREIVTADWTMADRRLGQLYPVERTPGEGWTPATWTDGRPAVGVLATNGFWWRYPTSGSNSNRTRANQISRILRCDDYLDSPVPSSSATDLLDEEALENSLKTDPACTGCHDTLDPLASFLWGFYRYADARESIVYHPEREGYWAFTDSEPAYYGRPGRGLADLGRFIAEDPVFVDCMATRMTEMAHGHSLEDAPTGAVDIGPARNALIETRSLKQALLAALSSQTPENSTAVMMRPSIMDSAVEDLTGFQMRRDGLDLLRSSEEGLLILAGGVDGYEVSEQATQPSPTVVLVMDRLAEGAARHLVAHPEDGRWDDGIDLSAHIDDDALTTLVRRALGRLPSDGERDGLTALFDEVEAEHDTSDAWAAVMAALLRDPDFLLY